MLSRCLLKVRCGSRITPKYLYWCTKSIEVVFLAGKMKLEFLENPSATLLGYSRISNLFQAYFWDFFEIACWYWPDLARIQASKLGLGRISLNFK